MKYLIETIIRCNSMASKESVRYLLSGVSIDVVEGKFRVRATDGHAFVQELTSVDAPKGFTARIIPSDAIPKLKLMLKNSPRSSEGFFLVEVSKERLKFGYGPNPDKPVESCDILCIDGEFPNTSHLSLEEGTRTFTLALNPELLMLLFKSMNSEKRDKLVTISVDPANPMAPLLVSHGDLKGVLMPMRINKKGDNK
jgi:DNA polymerase III sliding clamp (beta) subunit (PCNA family)